MQQDDFAVKGVVASAATERMPRRAIILMLMRNSPFEFLFRNKGELVSVSEHSEPDVEAGLVGRNAVVSEAGDVSKTCG